MNQHFSLFKLGRVQLFFSLADYFVGIYYSVGYQKVVVGVPMLVLEIDCEAPYNWESSKDEEWGAR